MTIHLTTEHAVIPRAVDAFQREPAKPLRYPWYRAWADAIAGWRDRSGPISDDPPHTAWLHRLTHELHTSLEAERKATASIIALLDDTSATHRRSFGSAEQTCGRLHQHIDELRAMPIDDAATTEAEQLDSASQRLLRRERDRSNRLAQLNAQLHQQQADINAAQAAVEILAVARQSHWTLMQVRGAHSIRHYNRRVATYIRSLNRRKTEGLRCPVLEGPDWLGQSSAPDNPATVPKRTEESA